MNAASELQALMLKGSPVMLDRDSGFCSDEELDLHVGTGAPSPPTDASEDSSVDVKVLPIGVASRNKRKCAEPLRIVNAPVDAKAGSNENHHPIKKRPRFTTVEDEETSDPFRPWSGANPAQIFNRHPGVTTLHRAFPRLHEETSSVPLPAQEEPLSLVANKNNNSGVIELTVSSDTPKSTDTRLRDDLQQQQQRNQHEHQQQRNYKNMTRERRIEANARERTRVHTISAAFDTLRRAIPAYSHNQKLSKLSVLRIACSYIMTLSRINGSAVDATDNSLADCVDLVSRTIQTEGKLRKKKDD